MRYPLSTLLGFVLPLKVLPLYFILYFKSVGRVGQSTTLCITLKWTSLNLFLHMKFRSKTPF